MKQLWPYVLLSLLPWLFPITVKAEQGTAFHVTELIEEALQNNPRIAAALAEWEAQKAQVGQVNVLDDPIVGFDSWNIPTDLDLDKTRTWIVFARQQFPAPGVLALRESVSQAKTLQALRKVEVIKQAIAQEVKQAYAELYLAEKTIEVTDRHFEILERFEKAADLKFSTGTVSQQDLLKAQVALARLGNQRLVHQQTYQTALASMNTLLNRPVRAPLKKVKHLSLPNLPEDGDQLETLAFQNQAALKWSAVSILQHERAVALSQKKWAPHFQVGLKRFENKGNHLSGGWGISASMNLPWVFGEKYKQEVLETESQVSSALAHYEHLRNETRYSIRDLKLKIETTARLVQLFEKEVIPKAEQSVASADAGYQADRVDFLDLLESERQLLDLRLEYFKALAAQYQPRSTLTRSYPFDFPHIRTLLWQNASHDSNEIATVGKLDQFFNLSNGVCANESDEKRDGHEHDDAHERKYPQSPDARRPGAGHAHAAQTKTRGA